jgi:hypothetical protein
MKTLSINIDIVWMKGLVKWFFTIHLKLEKLVNTWKKVEILYCTVQVKQYSRFVTSG